MDNKRSWHARISNEPLPSRQPITDSTVSKSSAGNRKHSNSFVRSNCTGISPRKWTEVSARERSERHCGSGDGLRSGLDSIMTQDISSHFSRPCEPFLPKDVEGKMGLKKSHTFCEEKQPLRFRTAAVGSWLRRPCGFLSLFWCWTVLHQLLQKTRWIAPETGHFGWVKKSKNFAAEGMLRDEIKKLRKISTNFDYNRESDRILMKDYGKCLALTIMCPSCSSF